MTHITHLSKQLIVTILTATVLISCLVIAAPVASADTRLPLPYADINQDGNLDTKDALVLFRAVATGADSALTDEARIIADTDGDGRLSVKDVQKIFQAIASGKDVASVAPAPSDYETEVFRLVNIEREKEGLTPLQYAYDIQAFADIRAKECCNYFSHTRPNGRICFSLFDDYQTDYFAGGENIAWGHQTPEEVVSAWMNSPGHRDNIMNPYFRAITVGCCEDPHYPGRYSWAQMFTY